MGNEKMEEKNETVKEEHDEEEKEKIETADELVKEKADNKFIARENTAQIQIFVQNANFDNKADIKQVLDLVNAGGENEKNFDLRKMEECAEFFGTCKKREYIALAIILSAFEIVPIGDYANLKDVLMEYLPAVLQADPEGKETCVEQTNSYIPLNAALSAIQGKIFITDDGQRCIGYGDGGEEVLGNIWVQFPDLRKSVINWLIRVYEMFEYKTSFEVYQVVRAFIRIITEDFQYSRMQVFERLYAEPANLGFIARLAQELLEDRRFRTDILNMVLRWMESESNWLWKSALLVCLHTYGSDIDGQLHKTMIRSMKGRLPGLKNSDLRFISLFAGNATNVRVIMAFVFYELSQSDNRQGKERLARIYLKMIRYGYYHVDQNKVDLPFVTCDSKEQMENMHFVLAYIMTRYDLYRQLCWTLQAYLEEISNYDVSSGTLNHLTAFFYVLTRDAVDYQEDILLFLSELKGCIAKKIYNKLIKIYTNSRGEKK
ncbi:MAG: hypothetical protein NC416_03280 [Eubacterium sp.]|nr:hypothetical protein [Eubacterium sp.]